MIGAVGVALLAGVAGAPFLFAEERAPSPPLAAVALEGGAATGNPPIGYLAERPSDKKSRRSAQAASEESRTSMSDAGTLGQDAANEPDAATRKVPAAAEGSRDASPAAAPANSNDPSASPR